MVGGLGAERKKSLTEHTEITEKEKIGNRTDDRKEEREKGKEERGKRKEERGKRKEERGDRR